MSHLTHRFFSRLFLPCTLLGLALAVVALRAQSESPAPGGRGAPSPAGVNAQGQEMVNTLIMVDQPLDQVLQYLEQLTGKAMLRSQSLPAIKINFNSLEPMTKDEAILAIESVLALNNILVTPVGDRFLKVTVSSGPGGATAQVPPFIYGSTLDLPPSQSYYAKYFQFKYLDASKEGTAIVQSLASAGTAPVPFPKNNALLVTDMLVNLQRIEEVLQTADQPDRQAENVFFFPLSHIKAADLSARLQKLITGDTGLARFFSNNTTFEADERTNQLIVITHPSNKPMLESLITELDKDVEPITNSEVIYIKHAQATDIQALLKEVIDGQRDAREKTDSAKKTTSPETETAPGPGGEGSLQADAAPLPSPTGGVSGLIGEMNTRNLQFSDFVTIVADERSNAIVAYGTKSDLAQINRLIDQIDVLLAQVFIEVIIAEVTLDDEHVSGISELGIYGTKDLSETDMPADFGFDVTGKAGSKLIDQAPFEISGSLSPDQFEIVIRTAQENSNVRILSAPNIVTTHNQEANINVSESRPIITSSVTNLTSSTSTDGTTSNDVQYRDIGIQLKVKPLIGSNGIIQMEIEQVVENVVSTTTINNTDQPIIGKREATSFVSVMDGEVIVLAGLQETRFSGSEGKLWLIGDIPIIGDLLNPMGELTERRELMIFIRPRVYFGPEDAQKHAREVITKLDNGKDVTTFLETNDMSDISNADPAESQDEANAIESSMKNWGPRSK